MSADNDVTEEKQGRHAAKEGAERHPLIDLARDPNPGRADHAKPDPDDDRAGEDA